MLSSASFGDVKNPESMSSTSQNHWVSHERAFLLTTGIILCAICASLFVAQGDRAADWPPWAWILIACLIVISLLFGCAGLFAGPHTVQRLAEHCGGHEGSLLIMLVAAPVYWLMKVLVDRKANQ